METLCRLSYRGIRKKLAAKVSPHGATLPFLTIVAGVGFEPTKRIASDLQSGPFGRSGNPPILFPLSEAPDESTRGSRGDVNSRPLHVARCTFFGHSRTLVPLRQVIHYWRVAAIFWENSPAGSPLAFSRRRPRRSDSEGDHPWRTPASTSYPNTTARK